MPQGSFPTRRRRHRAALLGAVAATLLIACAPPSGPPPGPGATSTTTSGNASTTTVVPSVCRATAGSTASGAIAAAPNPRRPAPLGSTSEIAAAAADAASRAEGIGTRRVTVVALDSSGRPALVPADRSNVVAVALETARHLDVIAVEVPSVVHALALPAATLSSADPRVKNQWALAAFPFAALWPCARGAGVTVAVVDSGVQADHPDFSGHVLPGAAILNGGPPQVGAGGTDANSHGTHVAGIIGAAENGVGIVGIAPEVTILPIRVLGADGSGLSTDIAQGITWATDHAADVVNLSLGSDIDSPSVDSAVAYAVSHDVVVVAAAGNTNETTKLPEYPAALPDVIAVSALAPSGAVDSYSTRGDYVDLAAPGSEILSTVPTSTWQKKSGTSMAAPHIAGLAALIIGARGRITPAAMLARLTSTATDAGPTGFDPAFGWGRVDPVAALNAP